MLLNNSETELTTGFTDFLIAIQCVVLILLIRRWQSENTKRPILWSWVLGLLAFASFLGAIVHGFELSQKAQYLLWLPLYLSLGLTVAMFVVCAVYDFYGLVSAKRLLPWIILIAIAFFVLTQILDQEFWVFIIFEAIAMLIALILYSLLAVKNRLKGAIFIAIGILLNIIAAVVQTSDVSMNLVFTFDHNGVFHLIQIVAIFILGYGLMISMKQS